MEYSSNQVSKMSGVSARTLRYYDEIGLLKPARIASSGYRIYGQAELDTLQQILFYKEMGFSLTDIRKLLSAPDFDREQAFMNHLAELSKKRERLDTLIETVTKSIAALRGEQTMSDKEKFRGFKQAMIDENEHQYGTEIREKYGEEAIERSNARIKGMTHERYAEGERLRQEAEDTLKAALEIGDPAGELAQKACDLHGKWLAVFQPEYNKAYHKSLGELYVADERFKVYYDKIAPGCAEFLRDAINIYCAG
ncbi:MAG TPA: MerR family transcriptional regulator [Firmicutes bacterium]|nr:MerR family transcriptional regulator [Bacillota bacterium]